MQTTLRINDELYRQAKAQAALEGSTLTKFIEDGIRLRLEHKQEAGKPFAFRVYRPEVPQSQNVEERIQLANEDFENYEINKLHSTTNPPH